MDTAATPPGTEHHVLHENSSPEEASLPHRDDEVDDGAEGEQEFTAQPDLPDRAGVIVKVTGVQLRLGHLLLAQ